jgi:hypothetical protein
MPLREKAAVDIHSIGKVLVLAGTVAILLGVALMFFDRIPLLGKLPGDIHIKRENVHIYVPIMSSIVLSIVITVILWCISHFRGK